MSSNVVVSAGKLTANDVNAMTEAQLQTAYGQAQTQQKAEIAEPEGPFADADLHQAARWGTAQVNAHASSFIQP